MTSLNYLIGDALHSLRPTAEFSVSGNSYDGIEWYSPDVLKPTLEEVTAEIQRLAAEYNNKQYQLLRAEAYPSIVDQLDKLYHEGYDGWKAQIKEIKDRYPK
jgi:hypothetical protein